ncbi:response regulator transcription factor [Streptomyces sp. CMB-StM0423]|uniref:response regulator transcription factor n=1 Tax=Streptomyces sp. CMB-StM0423 TaxID=2059884 RepID=UPI000C70A924|nr:response regulator transcription factor [Streptomyces sp. CMB-StM0423]AUH45274.1 DNA-binding response regulator [Streptomyces sp. CMB-StM0423]
MIRVLLVDDDALVRAGLQLMLASAKDIDVVAEAGDGSEVDALVNRHRPDLVLMDIRMPGMDGLEATRLLRNRPDAPEIVMLTTFTSDDYVLRALQAGAAGFLLKHTRPDRIIDAVRQAAAGEPVMSSEALSQLIDTVTTNNPEPTAPAGTLSAAEARRRLEALGSREHEVALAVSQGRTNADIAATLYMSVPTVKSHISHILAKLDLNNRVQIALLVYRAGLT